MYTIRVDKPRNLLVLSVSGYADYDSIVQLCADIRVAVPTLGPAAGTHDILCDLSKVSVGPADTIAVLMEILSKPEYREIAARRVALYTPSALSRMQLKRLKVRPGIEIFDSEIAAHRWLSEERAAIAA